MHPSQRLLGSRSSKLKGKTIVLAVTGSIAAVETVKLAHELIRHGADVVPIMSSDATEILHPNALHFATGKAPIIKIDGSMSYLELCGKGGSASILLIAPCTGNTISKIANGIDDTVVTTFATNALSSGVPIIIAPAMHETMYDQPILQSNIRKLRELGVEFVEPKVEEDKAKMAEVDSVVASVLRRLRGQPLKNKRVTVISGSTYEAIDDVRVLTNRSTGITGIELAKVAYELGADVELWTARHRGLSVSYIATRHFESLSDLLEMSKEMQCDICLVPAAISDYLPRRAKGKIPSGQAGLALHLDPAPKLLEEIRKRWKGFLVGFKLESGVTKRELISRARKRLQEQKLDLVVANDLARVKDDSTSVSIIPRKGKVREFSGSKAGVAEVIWSVVLDGLRG